MKRLLLTPALLFICGRAAEWTVVPPVLKTERKNTKGYSMTANMYADGSGDIILVMDTTVPWVYLQEGNLVQSYIQFLDNERSLPNSDFYDVASCSGVFPSFKRLYDAKFIPNDYYFTNGKDIRNTKKTPQ